MDKYVVAFIDILGYSNLIADTKNRNIKSVIEKIEHIIENCIQPIIENEVAELYVAENETLKYKIFSDSIMISLSVPSLKGIVAWKNIVSFIKMLMQLQSQLIENDIFIRGAMTVGQHYENNNIIFSRALIQAYKYESTKAIYPRIVIVDEALDFINEKIGTVWLPPYTNWIKRDADKIAFIDYLDLKREWLPYINFTDYLKLHKQKVVNQLDVQTSPRVLHKYIWIGNYHNYKIEAEKVPSLKKITIPVSKLTFHKDIYFNRYYRIIFKANGPNGSFVSRMAHVKEINSECAKDKLFSSVPDITITSIDKMDPLIYEDSKKHKDIFFIE